MKLTTHKDANGTIIKTNEAGFFHCETGPAKIFEDGSTQYWLNGYPYGDFDEYAANAKWNTEDIVEHKLMNETTNLL